MAVEQYTGTLWNSKGYMDLLWVSLALPAMVAQS